MHQRRRAALSPPSVRRRTMPTAAPSRAANSSRRVWARDAASTVARAAETAPDRNACSMIHSSSASVRPSARTRPNPRPASPEARNPGPWGRPFSPDHSRLVARITGRPSSAGRRLKAKTKAPAMSRTPSARTSSSPSARTGHTVDPGRVRARFCGGGGTDIGWINLDVHYLFSCRRSQILNRLAGTRNATLPVVAGSS